MANQAQFTVSDLRAAIRRVGSSVKALADELGCSRSTIYRYFRKYPELKDMAGAEIEDRPQYPKDVFERAIVGSHGVKATVAALVGCSRQTVDNALDKWPDLQEMLDKERSELINMAAGALVTDIMNKGNDRHQRAYMFVLRTLGKDEGFTERQEVTGADGAGLFDLSPEVVALLERMGVETPDVVKQFEQMVRKAAANKGIE